MTSQPPSQSSSDSLPRSSAAEHPAIVVARIVVTAAGAIALALMDKIEPAWALGALCFIAAPTDARKLWRAIGGGK